MKGKGTLIIVLALVIIAVLAAWRVYVTKHRVVSKTATELKSENGVPVETALVKNNNIESMLAINGDIKGFNEVPITPKVGGRILKIAVKDGQSVHQGQVLVQLDSTELRDAVKQAEAARGQAEAAVEQASVMIIQAGSGIDQANAGLKQAAGAVDMASAGKAQADSGIAQAKAAVDRAESGVKAAEQQLSLVRTGARTQEKTQVRNQVDLAESGFKTAQIGLDRMQSLFEKGIVPKSQLEMAQLQYDTAKMQYENAKQQMDIVNTGARDQEKSMAEQNLLMAKQGLAQAQGAYQQALAGADQSRAGYTQSQAAYDRTKSALAQAQTTPRQAAAGLKQAQAMLLQAEAGESFARTQLSNATIVAPCSGKVATVFYDEGTLVGQTSPYPLMTIIDDRSFSTEAEIAETDLPKVSVGQPVALTLIAVPGITYKGAVQRINPASTQGTKTYKISVGITEDLNGRENLDKLKSGLRANGNIIVQQKNTIVISKDALVRQPDNSYAVFVVDKAKGVARASKVELGIVNTVTVEITKGITVGDEVVVVGAGQLKDNDKILIKKVSN